MDDSYISVSVDNKNIFPNHKFKEDLILQNEILAKTNKKLSGYKATNNRTVSNTKNKIKTSIPKLEFNNIKKNKDGYIININKEIEKIKNNNNNNQTLSSIENFSNKELDSQQKTKNTRQQMTKNKDTKSTVDNKIKVQPKVPTGVYKSKAISSQKQDINKPKETKETTTTTTSSSIRRALLEKRAIQTNNQTMAQNQNKINPIPSKIQVQTKQPIQAQAQSKYIKRVVESKEPIITKNENSKER